MFGFFKRADINAGVEQYRSTSGAVLLDVRTAEEYAGGHIPGSVNVPLGKLEGVDQIAKKDTPLFVYCYSGARSGQAVAALKRMGYDHVTNIGGIQTYRGKTKGGTTA